MKNPLAARGIQDCWNHVGVFGDCSCPELRQVFHCKNCSVYTSAGRSLLEREPPADYIQEWKRVLEQPKETEPAGTTSVLIFRIFEKWFAIETKYLREVTEPRVIHRIPHRTGKFLMGLINVRGEILLCISLSRILEIEQTNDLPGGRMIEIEKDGERWVFPVDQVQGVSHVMSVTESGMVSRFHREGMDIGYLNSEMLFNILKKEAL